MYAIAYEIHLSDVIWRKHLHHKMTCEYSDIYTSNEDLLSTYLLLGTVLSM